MISLLRRHYSFCHSRIYIHDPPPLFPRPLIYVRGCICVRVRAHPACTPMTKLPCSVISSKRYESLVIYYRRKYPSAPDAVGFSRARRKNHSVRAKASCCSPTPLHRRAPLALPPPLHRRRTLQFLKPIIFLRTT